jgi:myo-inositol-1(or 4)-monophosphatase
MCGTLNYAVRNLLACLNVALRVEGQVTAAACADPFAFISRRTTEGAPR